MHRLKRRCARSPVRKDEDREQAAGQDFQSAENNPPRPGQHNGAPPRLFVRDRLFGQETEIVDLLSDLHGKRAHDADCRPEGSKVKNGPRCVVARKVRPRGDFVRCFDRDHREGKQRHGDPERLRRELETRDHGYAHGGDRNYCHRRDDVANNEGNVGIEIQRLRHNRAFQREEDESKAGVN